ncbi:MAG: DNA cytosine methyltransferase [Methanobrevibacter sp.]|nr:DNA cytosine methyltransferase [Methanobrevibacter sp.]
MENVPEVIGAGNVDHFIKWTNKLESLGYTNYFEILNAKDYGIPQNRRRCFMVSILGEYAYDFPLKHKARYCLKDFLEKDVPEKYFLNTKDIERISSWNAYEKPLENVLDVEHDNKEISTLTTHVGKDSAGMKLIGVPRYSDKSIERIEKNIVDDDNAPCITANAMQSINHQNCVLIKENNNKGFKEAHDGDGVNIASRMEHQRGNVQKGSIQTLKAQMEVGVVVEEKSLKQELCDKLIEEGKVEEMQVIRHSYSSNRLNNGDKNMKRTESVDINISPTLDIRCDCLGVVVDGNYGNGHHAKNVYNEKGIAPTITTGNHGLGTAISTKEENVYTDIEKSLFTKDGNINRYLGSEKVDEFKDGQMATTTYPNGWGHGPRTHNESIALNTIDRPSVKQNLRIRKLVPCETLKLMGFEKCDHQAMREVGMSDSAIYHCSGDSIVTTCLMALLGQMLPISEKELKQKIEDYVKSIVES